MSSHSSQAVKPGAPAVNSLGTFSPHVAKELEGSAPTFLVWQDIRVPMSSTSGIMREYSDALTDELNYIAECEQFPSLQSDEMYAYMRTLLKLRVRRVNRATRFTEPSYKNHVHFVVPAFLSLYLENVGVAQDASLGVKITPEFEDADPMKYEDFVRVERHLRRFESFGFEYATTIPGDTSGSWELMAMQVVDDRVCRHDAGSHMVYGLLGAMVANEQLQSILLPRVSYGHVARHRGLVRTLAKVGGKR